MLVSANVCVLYDVLRFTVIIENPTHNSIDTLIVSAHKDLEQCCLASADTPDHFFVGLRRQFRIDDRICAYVGQVSVLVLVWLQNLRGN